MQTILLAVLTTVLAFYHVMERHNTVMWSSHVATT